MKAPSMPWIRARVVPADGIAGAIERIGPLTTYLMQTIIEDAMAGGRGSTVLLDVRWEDPSQLLETLRRRVELLTSRGISVSIRCGESPRPGSTGRSAA